MKQPGSSSTASASEPLHTHRHEGRKCVLQGAAVDTPQGQLSEARWSLSPGRSALWPCQVCKATRILAAFLLRVAASRCDSVTECPLCRISSWCVPYGIMAGTANLWTAWDRCAILSCRLSCMPPFSDEIQTILLSCLGSRDNPKRLGSGHVGRA